MILFQKINDQDKEDFAKSLSLLIKNGTPINYSFDILSKQTSSKILKKSLSNALDRIEKGSSISQALSESGGFDSVFISFIRAGEESGTLTENLNFLAKWLERSNKLKKDISTATLYPKIIVVMAGILGSVLTVFILPRLVPVFNVLNIDLPLSTRILLYFSRFVSDYGIYIIISMPIILIGIFFLFRWMPVKKIYHRNILRLPVFGNLAKDYQLTIIAQLIAVLFKSGLTIGETLKITGESVTNLEYRKILKEISVRVDKGTNMAEAIGSYPSFFPGVFKSMVATGEEAGSYSESFEYLSDFFSTKVKSKIEKLPTIIEPLLLIFIGLLVAFLATAIILPIYEITKGLR